MKRANQIPCVFRGSFVREQVDPRVKEEWPGHTPPWGDLRRTWKEQHCLRVNPTGFPQDCPYPEEDCALAFLQCVLIARGARKPMALFRAVARAKGAERADNKPLAREGPPERRVGDHRGGGLLIPDNLESTIFAQFSRSGVLSWPTSVSSASPGPVAIGSLLGTYDLGPRKGRADDGEEGAG